MSIGDRHYPRARRCGDVIRAAACHYRKWQASEGGTTNGNTAKISSRKVCAGNRQIESDCFTGLKIAGNAYGVRRSSSLDDCRWTCQGHDRSVVVNDVDSIIDGEDLGVERITARI